MKLDLNVSTKVKFKSEGEVTAAGLEPRTT